MFVNLVRPTLLQSKPEVRATCLNGSARDRLRPILRWETTMYVHDPQNPFGNTSSIETSSDAVAHERPARYRAAAQTAELLAARAASGQPIVWSPALSIGIDSIDGQHRVLVAYINQLASAIARGQSSAILKMILAGLDGYTRIHFRHEERLFAMHGWDHDGDHAAGHKAFCGQLADFRRRFDAGDTALAPEVLRFMIQWLAEHILLDDAAYSDHLKAHGVH
jgi:hemerythrin-like metal-binding protein